MILVDLGDIKEGVGIRGLSGVEGAVLVDCGFRGVGGFYCVEKFKFRFFI